MLKKTILSTALVITSSLLTACFDTNDDQAPATLSQAPATLSEASHKITAISVLGTSSEDSTAIANGGTDSNNSTTEFEILLPLDDSALSADLGDGSTVSDMINLQVLGGNATTKTVNIGLVINPS